MQTVEDLLSLPEYVLGGVRKLFDARNPFGPSSAAQFRDAPEIQDLVFSSENEIWREYQSGPRIVVGRKGSGKTSILARTERADDFALVHKPSTSKLFDDVEEVLFPGGEVTGKVRAEKSAKVWRDAINLSLIRSVVERFINEDFPRCKKLLISAGIDVGEKSWNIVNHVKRSTSDSGEGEASFIFRSTLDILTSSSIDVDDAISEIDSFLELNNKKIVILIDSIEEYDTSDFKTEQILKGLLRCVGNYGTKYRSLRMAIPAEAYHELLDISSNVSKDFHDYMALHWTPIELLRMVAWRRLIYLSAYHPDLLEAFRDIDLSDRSHVHRVLRDFLPREIRNRGGQLEFTEAYLLRHTQLLPRQMIILLNAAFSNNRPNSPRAEDREQDNLVIAVQEVQARICQEVYNAYSEKYPFAKALCMRVLPNLPRFFYEEDLQDEYRGVGKQIIVQSGKLVAPSFYDFLRVLFEIGAVGRVIEKENSYVHGADSTLYADAEFEYARPDMLSCSRKDELCLHPAFSGANESGENRQSKHYVYPHKHLYDENIRRRVRVT